MSNAKIQSVAGKAIPLRGGDIDTDRIIPARFLRCVTFDGLGEHAFEDDRQQDPNHPFNQDVYKDASVLIAGKNFGCGSSREHAPQSLSKWGIKGIIAESYAEIFFGNCQAMGIPCFTADEATIDSLQSTVEGNPDVAVEMDIASAKVTIGDDTIQANYPDGPKNALLSGTWNATAVLLEAADKIDDTAASLPYINNFG